MTFEVFEQARERSGVDLAAPFVDELSKRGERCQWLGTRD